MRTFSVKNFEKFQHYKDRSPPWIKLYNELLDDYEFGLLPDASKMHLIAIWLLASRSENKIPFDPTWVARRINATEKVNLSLLVDRGFILLDQELQTVEQLASKPLAECLSREREREREETEDIDKRQRREETREIALSDDWPFNHPEEFWMAWPNKVGKPAAMKALSQARKRGASFDAILDGVRHYIRDKPPDRPWLNPATFLNQNRWEDQPATVQGLPNGRRTVQQAADDLLEKLRAFDEPAPSDLCDGTGENAVRLLSSR